MGFTDFVIAFHSILLPGLSARDSLDDRDLTLFPHLPQKGIVFLHVRKGPSPLAFPRGI